MNHKVTQKNLRPFPSPWVGLEFSEARDCSFSLELRPHPLKEKVWYHWALFLIIRWIFTCSGRNLSLPKETVMKCEHGVGSSSTSAVPIWQFWNVAREAQIWQPMWKSRVCYLWLWICLTTNGGGGGVKLFIDKNSHEGVISLQYSHHCLNFCLYELCKLISWLQSQYYQTLSLHGCVGGLHTRPLLITLPNKMAHSMCKSVSWTLLSSSGAR